MKIDETCNDSHFVDIKLTKKDIDRIIKGEFIFIECKKDETEIWIGMDK